MVYSPRFYFVSAAVASVAVQMQQASAGSMYYSTYTTSEAANTLSSIFPGAGIEVAEQNTRYEKNIDATLPNVTTIPRVPVPNPEFLTNTTNAPIQPVSTIVGTPMETLDGTLLGESKPTDCATGWEAPPRKLVESHRLRDEQSRRLTSTSNRDIEKLEAHFGVKLETKLSNLPTQAEYTPQPWAGPYWATFLDSINVQFDPDQPSPAAKYATAFGMDVTEFMNKISATHGIDSRVNALACSEFTDCTATSFCAMRNGQSKGICIPTWVGICHAWAAAAISEKEPNCPVTHNNVTFQPLDLKGLISIVYDDTNIKTVFTGARFRTGITDTDEFGRPKDEPLRDINPGFFHLVAANLLGKLKSSFVVDVSAGLEVWNHPVLSFKVLEQTAMSLEEAAQTFYGLKKYPWNEAAKGIVYVKTRLSWIIEAYIDGGLVASGSNDQFIDGSDYTYLLEMDSKKKIIGGEWLYNSSTVHPDFLWLLREKPSAEAVTSTGISYAEVSMLLKKSVECSDSPSESMISDESTGRPATETTQNPTLATSSNNDGGDLNNHGDGNNNNPGSNHNNGGNHNDNNPGGNNNGGNHNDGGNHGDNNPGGNHGDNNPGGNNNGGNNNGGNNPGGNHNNGGNHNDNNPGGNNNGGNHNDGGNHGDNNPGGNN